MSKLAKIFFWTAAAFWLVAIFMGGRLQLKHGFGNPWWFFGIAFGGFIFCMFFRAEIKISQPLDWESTHWATTALSIMFVALVLLRPPLPTPDLFAKADQGDADALYWVQLYERSGTSPLNFYSGGAQ